MPPKFSPPRFRAEYNGGVWRDTLVLCPKCKGICRALFKNRRAPHGAVDMRRNQKGAELFPLKEYVKNTTKATYTSKAKAIECTKCDWYQHPE